MKVVSKFLTPALGVLGCLQGQAWAAMPLWNFATTEPVQASPAIAPDGTVYLASYDRVVYALTPEGEIKWTNNLPPPIYIYFATYAGVYGTPAVGADGTLYVPSENGKLLAFNPTNGALKWDYSTVAVEGLYSSPAIGPDGTIYFGSFDENLYAIHPDGTRKWASRFASTIFASPAVGRDGTIYCGCDDGKLYAINPNNGQKRWTFDTGPKAISASPAIAGDGTLLIGVGSAGNPLFYSISTNGTTNWVFMAGGRVRSSAALAANGTIYVGCDDGKLYALNPDGTKKWDFPAGGAIGSSPAIAADGTIYFGCDDGKLYAVSAGGSLLWTFQTSDSVFASPAIGPDGAVYFASTSGVVYVLRGCRPPVVSDWPMFRQGRQRAGRVPDAATNRPPVLAAIGDRTIPAGSTLTVANSASDPDGAASELRFSLGLGAPAGASIHPASGVFQWTPAQTNALATNWISVVVTDAGFPVLTDAQCFRVVVMPRLRVQGMLLADAMVKLQWTAIPGRTYRVQYKSSLSDLEWVDLPGDITADSDTALKIDDVGAGVPQRFYRVEELP